MHKTFKFANINLDDYCKDQDMETCELKLESIFSNICILTLYRTPSGNFDQFLNRLESIFSMLHSPKTEFIICGDISVNILSTVTENKTWIHCCYLTIYPLPLLFQNEFKVVPNQR